MANAFPIAEGELEISADPSQALRNVQAFLRQVDQRLHRAEENAERSGRAAGRRFGDGLSEGFRNAPDITDLILGPTGGGGGGGGGGGDGFIQGFVSTLTGGFRSVVEAITELVGEIEDILANLGGSDLISDLWEDLQDLISNLRSGFTSFFRYVQDTFTRLFGSLTGGPVSTFFSNLLARARAYWTRFTAWAGASFSAMWTRITGWWGSMNAGLRSFWTRFVTWSVTSFGFLTGLARSFWSRFRSWASSTFSRLRAWTSGWINALGVMGRWAFAQIRRWASGIWTRASGAARSLWTRVAAWARTAFSAISGWFQSLWSSLSSGARAVWGQLQSALSSLSSVAGQAGPLLQAGFYASLIPVILGLGGAIANLLPLLLLLPAAIGVLGAAIAPAIVGFKGLGEAIGAGLAGDVDKLNEAMKKLTPNARAFVREFIKLGPALKEIKRRTQDALFKPLLGTIAPLAKTLLPALAAGMEKAAGALGRFLAAFARMLGTPEVISAINALFATTARILDKLGPPLASLFGALFGTIEGGLPWIERFVDVIATGIQRFADWLRLIKGNGDMQRWLETAWSTAKDFWAVIVQLGLVFKNLFADTGDEGQTFLQNLAISLERLNKWLTSDNGKDFLDDVVDAIWVATTAIDYLVWIIGLLGDTWLIVKQSAQAAWGALVTAWEWITKAAAATWKWISNIAKVSWDWIKNAAKAVGDFFVMIGEGFVTAWDTVAEWGGKIIDWFASLPGIIGTFFASIPGWIAAGLAALRDAVSYGIGYIAGLIVRTFLDLPAAVADAWNWITAAVSNGAAAAWGAVTAWAANVWNSFLKLGSDMLSAVDSAWDAVYESTVNGISAAGAWISALPGRVGGWLSSLPGVVGSWFSNAWNRGRENTSRGVSDVVGEVGKLGGKIGNALAGAGRWLYETGRDMLRGLIDGIGDMWGWAVDQAKAAARAIKKGFMDALEVKSPSRVMRVEVGRQLLPGVMLGVDDTIPAAQKHLGAVANMMVEGFQPTVNVAAPNVHTGDVMLQADFGEGIRQAVPLIITRNPRTVAGATAVGNRQRTGWVNTARGVAH